MHSTIGIDIDAPPALVFALAHDVERWERLLPHYARSRARSRAADGRAVVDFVARRALVPWLGLGLPVAWRSRVVGARTPAASGSSTSRAPRAGWT